MKKKYITEWQWNKLYDELENGLGTPTDDGGRSFSSEEWDEYTRRLEQMPEYKIIGVCHQLDMMKTKFHDYKLRHLKLGKVVYDGKPFEFNSFKIGGISWDIHWQLNRYLAIIIRDYLNFFADKTQAIGNYVIENNPEGLTYEEALHSEDIDFGKRWIDKVHDVSSEFDELRKLIEMPDYSSENNTIPKQANIAFKALADIFDDLSW